MGPTSFYPSQYLKPKKKKIYILTHAYIRLYPTILKFSRNDSGPKRPRAETTHLPRPKQPTPKIGLNNPGRNYPAKTTQGPNDPEPWDSVNSSQKPFTNQFIIITIYGIRPSFYSNSIPHLLIPEVGTLLISHEKEKM